ncbi:MAG: SDR family oxidoreductase [Rhizobiaceae bacterium]
MHLNLDGKHVLITGASQGIGQELALSFAGEGCSLHLVARSADKLEMLRNKIVEDHGVDVTCTIVDMTDDDAIARIVEDAGTVDILVNNAGTVPSGNLWEVDSEAWRAGWKLKGFGYVDLTRAVYADMRRRGGGVILNNIGNGGEICDPEYIAGATANASLMAFTRALGGCSLNDGIRVVGVNPGPVNTDRIFKMLKQRAETLFNDETRYIELVEKYPLRRPAHVSEIVDMFLFLASERSAYTSGTVITIDGGISARRSVI